MPLSEADKESIRKIKINVVRATSRSFSHEFVNKGSSGPIAYYKNKLMSINIDRSFDSSALLFLFMHEIGHEIVAPKKDIINMVEMYYIVRAFGGRREFERITGMNLTGQIGAHLYANIVDDTIVNIKQMRNEYIERTYPGVFVEGLKTLWPTLGSHWNIGGGSYHERLMNAHHLLQWMIIDDYEGDYRRTLDRVDITTRQREFFFELAYNDMKKIGDISELQSYYRKYNEIITFYSEEIRRW